MHASSPVRLGNAGSIWLLPFPSPITVTPSSVSSFQGRDLVSHAGSIHCKPILRNGEALYGMHSTACAELQTMPEPGRWFGHRYCTAIARCSAPSLCGLSLALGSHELQRWLFRWRWACFSSPFQPLRQPGIGEIKPRVSAHLEMGNRISGTAAGLFSYPGNGNVQQSSKLFSSHKLRNRLRHAHSSPCSPPCVSARFFLLINPMALGYCDGDATQSNGELKTSPYSH